MYSGVVNTVVRLARTALQWISTVFKCDTNRMRPSRSLVLHGCSGVDVADSRRLTMMGVSVYAADVFVCDYIMKYHCQYDVSVMLAVQQRYLLDNVVLPPVRSIDVQKSME